MIIGCVISISIGSGIAISICIGIGCVIRIVIRIAISIGVSIGFVRSTTYRSIYRWTEMRLTEVVSLMMIGFV